MPRPFYTHEKTPTFEPIMFAPSVMEWTAPDEFTAWTRILYNVWCVADDALCTSLQNSTERLEIWLGEKPMISIPMYILACAWLSMQHGGNGQVLRQHIVIPRRQTVKFRRFEYREEFISAFERRIEIDIVRVRDVA